MKKLLVHIGTPKTGSSSIQESLVVARSNGQLPHVTYPPAWGGTGAKGRNHNFIAALYKNYDEFARGLKHRYGSTRLRRLEKDRLAYRRNLHVAIGESKNTIISAESMASFSFAQARAFRDDVNELGLDDIAIVVYVRDPVSRYPSSIQQKLKSSYSFKDPREYDYRFRAAIECWESVFPGKLTVRPFAKPLLHNGCVVQDFLDLASRFFAVDLRGLQVVNVNESVSAEGMILLRDYRRRFYRKTDDVFKPDSKALVQALRESKKAIPQTKPAVGSAIASIIYRRHADDLAWLHRMYGIRLGSEGNESIADPQMPVPGDGDKQPFALEEIIAYREDILQDVIACLLERLPARSVVHRRVETLAAERGMTVVRKRRRFMPF